MARETRPAVLYLRMSPQLRDGLRAAADDAGCSLNAFAVQVLATAAGDAARFRVPTSPDRSHVPDARGLERDALGYPLEWKARWQHSVARNEFIGAMQEEMPPDEMVALVKRFDAEDPGYFVEWRRLRRVEREDRESSDRRGAA